MLRRKPTALTITPEDLIAFEEERLQKAAAADRSANEEEQEKADAQAAADTLALTGKKYDPNDELKPLPGDKARIVRSRDERIGIDISYIEYDIFPPSTSQSKDHPLQSGPDPLSTT